MSDAPSRAQILDLIGEFGAAVYYLLDDCETSGPIGGEIHTITSYSLQKVGDLLDRIDMLPFEKSGYALGTGAMLQEAIEQTDLPATDEQFQNRVDPWMQVCFGPEVSADKLERGDRLLEEVLELLQSGDYPRERIAALTDYTYGREKGEPAQEVGGVMVTLAAYCLAHDLDMHTAGETELARVWTKVEKIRAKQAAKPTGSPLPIAVDTDEQIAARLHECVKPLEWEDHPINGEPVYSMATTALGTYFIIDDTDDFSGLYLDLISHDNAKWWQHVRPTATHIEENWHGDIQPLKDKAQAHYTAQIMAPLDLSALKPAADPRVQALVEEIKRMRSERGYIVGFNDGYAEATKQEIDAQIAADPMVQALVEAGKAMISRWPVDQPTYGPLYEEAQALRAALAQFNAEEGNAMSDNTTPKRIWAIHKYVPLMKNVLTGTFIVEPTEIAETTEYHRADLSAKLVQAAFISASVDAQNMGNKFMVDLFRDRAEDQEYIAEIVSHVLKDHGL
jgi:uncharacterized small protein (DUF1192 family)